MTNQASSWNYLRTFSKLFEKTEVPQRFALWCGVSSLMAVLERRVVLHQGVFDVYPNFYIILVAAAGQKKSTPINYVGKLLRRLPVRLNIVAQKISTEALVSALKKQVFTDVSTKTVHERSGGLALADELTTFLDKGALEKGLLPALTKLYDCSPFDYQTIGRGIETVDGGYLSILGGTTVDLIRRVLTPESITSGLGSRTIFVYEDKRENPVPWVDFDEGVLKLEEELVAYLGLLQKLSGSVIVSAGARAAFEKLYNDRYYHSPFATVTSLHSYENRRDKHLLKIAIAMMVSETPQLILQEPHIHQAEALLSDAEKNMPRVMDLIIASDIGSQNASVYDFILGSNSTGVSLADIMHQFSNRLSKDELMKSLDTLVVSQRVSLSTRPGQPGLWYQAQRSR